MPATRFRGLPITGGRQSMEGNVPVTEGRQAMEEPFSEHDPFDVYRIPGITEDQLGWYKQTMEQLLGPWMQMMSGQPDLDAIDTLYNESIYGPGEREMEQSIIPKTRASFTGPGFWGTARAGAEERAWGDFESQMGARRGELYAGAYQQAQQNALSALSPWMQMLGFETFTPMLSENFPNVPSFNDGFGGTSITSSEGSPIGLGTSPPKLGVPWEELLKGMPQKKKPSPSKTPSYWR